MTARAGPSVIGFDELVPFDVNVPPSDVTPTETIIHGRKGGSVGPVVLLLHGHPQTHYSFHRLVPLLTPHFFVVIPDLRGHGGSSKPLGDQEHAKYSKREMARDIIYVMDYFGHPRFCIVGHDRGGRVGHRMAVDWPEHVERLVVLDIVPTLTMYEKTNIEFATKYWHWFFLIQDAPFPETFINSQPIAYLAKLFSRPSSTVAATIPSTQPSAQPSLIEPVQPDLSIDAAISTLSSKIHTPEAVTAYYYNIRDPRAVHAMCEDYRASRTIDLSLDGEDRTTALDVFTQIAADAETDLEDEEAVQRAACEVAKSSDAALANRKHNGLVQCPVKVLWASKGVIEELYDPLAEWGLVVQGGKDRVKGRKVESGHYLPEERPEEVAGEVLTFLEGVQGL